jgi:hypothetical protein
MTITQRQVHLGFWLVLGPAIVILAALAILHRPAGNGTGTRIASGTIDGAAVAGGVGVVHER